MAQIRDILNHLTVENAARKRICHRNRNNHSIEKGERCLVIQDMATRGSKNYCGECAKPILDAAKMRLSALEQEMS
jgi:hypothetical protein